MKTYPLTLFFLFICSYNVFGYNIRQITNNDGLSNSAIHVIVQDNNGFMWFGSCDGINIFNGTEISLYNSADIHNNLSGNLIEKMIEAQNGIIWTLTNSGLNRVDYEKRQIRYFPYFEGNVIMNKNRDDIFFIFSDDEMIYYFDEELSDFFQISLPDVFLNDVRNFHFDENKRLCIFFSNGEFRTYLPDMNSEKQLFFTLEKTIKHDTNILHCFNDENLIHFVDDNHLFYEYNLSLNTKKKIFDLSVLMTKNGGVSSIIKHNGNYYIGFKTNGLIRLKSSSTTKEYSIEDLNIKSGIFHLYKDKFQDIIWVGTDGEGVFLCYDDSYSIKSNTFNDFPFEIRKPVRAIFLDDEKTLWIGTKGDGIVKIFDYKNNTNIHNNKIQRITTNNSTLRDNSVYEISKSRHNLLWIGTEEGLDFYSYDDAKIRPVKLLNENNTPIKYIHSIIELNDSEIWIASVGMGIIKANYNIVNNRPIISNVKQITISGGTMSSNYFFTNFVENDSVIWFGNRGKGAFRINTKTLIYDAYMFSKDDYNRPLNDVFSINQDVDGDLWFGTSMGLVKYFDNGNIKVFNEQSGFPNNTIHSIIRDSENNLWLSTNKGIIRFDPENETFQIYNKDSGLKINEFSDGSCYIDKETGEMFFGGIDGFIAITATGHQTRDYSPPVFFNKMTIFGQEVNISDFYDNRANSKSIVLTHNQKFFTLAFSTNDFINANNYNFFYRINEMSEYWVDNDNSRNISFTNMSPGKYTLQLKYKNRITNKESSIYSLIINIRPPWYRSLIARVSYSFLCIAAFFILIYFIARWNEKKRAALLEKIKQQHQEEVHESKLRFFTNIAHEFCTPLTLIYGPCERILSHAGVDNYVIDYTKIIQRNALRLNDLIQDLIEFRRIETGNKTLCIEKISITETAYDIINTFSEAFESQMFSFEYSVPEEFYWNSDKSFIYTIITNLISNALKYTNQNGKIGLKIEKSENVLVIIVSNTGKGIKKEDFETIFNRYSVLDNFENTDENASTARNGLGLAISNSMVKLLDGSIKIRSELNKETSFTVRLPKKEITPPIKNVKMAESKVLLSHAEPFKLPNFNFSENKKTIFVIDDDVEILWLICEIFTEDFNVKAFREINNIDSLFLDIYPDIIICDVMLPSIDGINIVKKIKAEKKTAHIPIVLVSAKHGINEQIEGIAAGAEMYIAKPFNVDYLKISIARLLSRKEDLKNYFASPLSAFDFNDGKLTHKENKQFIQNVLDAINSNLLEKDLSAQFIADKMNFSVRHLYRKVNECCDQSLSEMIKACKLHVARQLLLETKMTIDEVAYNSGFLNRTTFYNTFASKYNCTPKEFRNKAMRGIDDDDIFKP